MIPRIAHFHWTGPAMSWLRMMSIATFRFHNPGWEIRLHDTPEDIRKWGLMYCQEADWTWWRALHEHGGLQVATDIVFLRPIPEEWLQYDMVACRNGNPYFVYHNAAFGAVPKHPYVQRCLDMCDFAAKDKPGDFQAFGPSLMGFIQYDFGTTKFFDMPMDAFCSVNFAHAPHFWNQGVQIPDTAIGVHWYGGDSDSKVKEPLAGPTSNYPIVHIANGAMVRR